MRAKRSTAFAAAVATVALAGSSIALSGTAFADPAAGIQPSQLVGVGSDTIQDVVNALSGQTINGNAYTPVTEDGWSIASYNAIDPTSGVAGGNITVKAGGPAFARPNGSGDGVAALSDSLLNAPFKSSAAPIGGQVDFARSSSGPSVTGDVLTYIPLARDAVGYVTDNAALASLTPAQLTEIYSATTPVTINGVIVHAEIPQANSGTRKFFLKQIGVPDTASLQADPVEENQADDAIPNNGSATVADIVPFSAGSWSAQLNGIAPDHSKTAATAGAFFGKITIPTASAPGGEPVSPVTTAADGTVTPNPVFYADPTFGRDVYDVVPTREIDTASPFFNKAVYDTFATVGTHIAGVDTAAEQAVISKFGFVNEPWDGSIDPSFHGLRGGLTDGNATVAPPTGVTPTVTTGIGTLNASWKYSGAVAATDFKVTVKTAAGTVAYSKDVLASVTSVSLTGLAAGPYTVTVVPQNLFGASTTAPVQWSGSVSAKSSSSVSVTSSTKVGYGSKDKFSIKVAAPKGAAVPTGTVEVLDGTKIINKATLVKGAVAVDVLKLSLGSHSFAVKYLGDTKTLASSHTVKFTVVKATPALHVGYPGKVSHSKTFKVSVALTAPSHTATGTVRIYLGKTLVGHGTLKSGKVTVTVSKLKAGRHTLTVRYYGDTDENSASKTFVTTSK
jgi:hypothetical protein